MSQHFFPFIFSFCCRSFDLCADRVDCDRSLETFQTGSGDDDCGGFPDAVRHARDAFRDANRDLDAAVDAAAVVDDDAAAADGGRSGSERSRQLPTAEDIRFSETKTRKLKLKSCCSKYKLWT